jgi:hypothetical protein
MTLDKTQPRLDALQMANEGRLLYDGDATYYIRDEFDETSADLCQQAMQASANEVLADELTEGDFNDPVVLTGGTQLIRVNLTAAGVATLADWQS